MRHNSTGGITRQLSNGSLPMYTASPGSSSSVGSANSAYFSGTSSNGHESPFKKCRSGSPSGGIFGKVMKFLILVFIGGLSYLCYVLNQNSISLKSEVNGFSATLEEKKSLERSCCHHNQWWVHVKMCKKPLPFWPKQTAILLNQFMTRCCKKKQ